MSQAISFKSVLLIAGGADGDLEAHLEGKRLFAGRAGRENALPFDCLAARDTYKTNVSAWVKIFKQNPSKASKESEENGMVERGRLYNRWPQAIKRSGERIYHVPFT